jgi:hypothetical protein
MRKPRNLEVANADAQNDGPGVGGGTGLGLEQGIRPTVLRSVEQTLLVARTRSCTFRFFVNDE